ncbi:MAG: hypothetical protein ABSH56_25675 [Bryobacteraceae bacterium]
MDLNLDTLKREMLDYLAGSELAVFFGSPGGLEGMPMVLWDTERHPDYQMFLEVARKAGASMVVFAAREFEASDIDDLLGHLDDCGLERDERRDYEKRLRELRPYLGVTCSIELAFDYHLRMYVYELQPDWYEEFLEIEDEIVAHVSDEHEDAEDDGLGGYFSNN